MFSRRLRRLVRLATLGLLLAAISQEMSKPEASRTWRGKLWGIVPYDFRPPSWDRLREAYWNPSDDRIFTDRPFGVGWALNFYQLRDLVIQTFESLTGSEMPAPVKNFGAPDTPPRTTVVSSS
jgi:hypothetical protein